MEGGITLSCTERSKVHHAYLDAPEGSEPIPRANEKVFRSFIQRVLRYALSYPPAGAQ